MAKEWGRGMKVQAWKCSSKPEVWDADLFWDSWRPELAINLLNAGPFEQAR